MNETKIERLNRLGFDCASTEMTTQQAPQERWYVMLERLEKYHETNKSFDVEIPQGNDKEDKTIKQLKAWKRWVDAQKYQYRAFRNGDPAALITERKIQNLEAIGFQFNYEPFPVCLELYKKFREEHKTAKIPEGHPLHDWVKHVRGQMRLFEKGKGKYDKLTQEQYDQLIEAKVHSKKDVREVKDPERIWQQHIEELWRYKQEHGDCLVKMSHPRTDFQKWVLNIRSWGTIIWRVEKRMPLLSVSSLLFKWRRWLKSDLCFDKRLSIGLLNSAFRN